MNKLKITLGLVFTMLLASCGGSLESDAKKIADLQCKIMKMSDDILDGDMDASASIALAEEAEKLEKEMKGKYTTDEEREEFGKALLKALGDCM